MDFWSSVLVDNAVLSHELHLMELISHQGSVANISSGIPLQNQFLNETFLFLTEGPSQRLPWGISIAAVFKGLTDAFSDVILKMGVCKTRVCMHIT